MLSHLSAAERSQPRTTIPPRETSELDSCRDQSRPTAGWQHSSPRGVDRGAPGRLPQVGATHWRQLTPQGSKTRSPLRDRVPGRPDHSYVPALDGLRALAISLVFVTHMITPVRFGGQVGVDVFFVLSGYLITSILLRENRRAGTIRRSRFYVRRLIRLYPSLLVAIVVLFVPGMLFAPSAFKYALENVLAVTYTMPLALQLNSGAAWAWRHTWSLGIEELFYLAWPTMLLTALRCSLTLKRTAVLSVALGLLLLIIPVVLQAAEVPASLLFRSGGLFVGCAFAALVASNPSLQFRASFGWVGLALIAGGVALDTVWMQEPISVLLAVTGTVLVVGHIVTMRDTKLSKMLGKKPLAYVGRISYELYLFHYPVLIILAWAFLARPLDVAPLAAPISIALAVATSAVLTPWIDRWKQRAARNPPSRAARV